MGYQPTPFTPVGGKRRPVFSNTVVIQVFKYDLSPSRNGATLGTRRAKDREECLSTKAVGIHAEDMAKPTETTGAELRLDGGKTTLQLHGGVGDIAVGGIGDAQHIMLVPVAETQNDLP